MLGNSSTATKFVKSSFPLQLSIHFHWLWTFLFFFINLALFIYKYHRFFYPDRYFGWDMLTIFLFAIVNYIRLLFASKGNKTCDSTSLINSLIIALPLIVLHVYYLDLQTYVLRLDLALNSISLFLLGTESLFSIVLLISLGAASQRY